MPGPDWTDLNILGGVHIDNEVQVDVAAHPDAPQSVRYRHRLRGTDRWWQGWPSNIAPASMKTRPNLT
jgi:hypothetical protein